MNLLQYQNIISKITTIKKERNLFFTNRIKYIQKYNFNDDYIHKLLALDSFQIQEFSEGLIRKRWGVVKKLLYLSNEQIEYLRPFYFNYAENTPIKGRIYKHQFDAYYFAVFILKKRYKLDSSLSKLLKNRKQIIRDYLIQEQQLKKSFFK